MKQCKNARFGNIKEKHIKALFNMIASSPGISRAQLAREAGLSKPAVSAFVDELVSMGLVKMTGEAHIEHAGRKPICLEVDSSYGVFLTVALAKKQAFYRLYDFSMKLMESFELPVRYEKGCIERLVSSIHKHSRFLDGKNIICSCFVLPAATNAELSEIRSTVLDLSEELNLISELKALKAHGAKVIANETMAYVYAEQRFARQKDENLVFVEVAEGVGAGIIIEDKVFRGVNGSAGEFGHMSVDKDGKKCCCGRRGCLELAVSKPAILKRAVAAGVFSAENYGYKSIAAEFSRGNKKAEELYRSIARDLAFGLGNMIAMFDISTIVLGGGIEELGSGFLRILRGFTDKLLISGDYRKKSELAISYAKLDKDAKNLGAAKYFCDHILPVTEELKDDLYFI